MSLRSEKRVDLSGHTKVNEKERASEILKEKAQNNPNSRINYNDSKQHKKARAKKREEKTQRRIYNQNGLEDFRLEEENQEIQTVSNPIEYKTVKSEKNRTK